jgi:hypothetical protein
MNCERIKERFADYLTWDLDEAARRDVQDHIASCPACREELENLTAMWARLGVLPEEQPSGALRGRFYAMLEEAKTDIGAAGAGPRRRFLSRWKEWFTFRRPAFAASLSIFLLLLGAGAGWFMRGGAAAAAEVADLRSELRDMRQNAALTLLRQPSAADRLQGISYTEEVLRPDSRTLDALIETLDSDPNPNVRLAAVEALYLFRNQPGVRASLVRSLSIQDSPLVQVALIDLLVELREQRAAEALKALIQNSKLNPEVKKFAEEGLKKIV